MKKSEQQNLELDVKKEDGPVECLGMTFEDDEARRAYFTEKLREKLKDPEFRKIEGFPIGEDEDILALSDPPYYTACPNPFLEDFIKHYGKPFNAKEKYHREPFAADVKEGKNHPIYKAHSYHTKVPHKAIMRYILNYTEPGEIVFDGFCGTGMTGVAAQLCDDRLAIQELGFRVKNDGTIIDEKGVIFSKIGARRTILSELSPAATFITYNYNMPPRADIFKQEAEKIFEEFDTKCSWMYKTLINATEAEINLISSELDRCRNAEDCREFLHSESTIKKKLKISDSKIKLVTVNCIVWTDIFICPECAEEINYWERAVDKKKGKARSEFTCEKCNAIIKKNRLERAITTHYDEVIGKSRSFAKQLPVLIDYTNKTQRDNKIPDKFDCNLIRKIEELSNDSYFPINPLPDGFNTSQPKNSHGVEYLHHFYTKRNIVCLSYIYEMIRVNNNLLFLFTSMVCRATLMNRIHLKNFIFGGGGWNAGYLKGTLYISSLPIEISVIEQFKNRLKSIVRCYNSLSPIKGYFVGATMSSTNINLPENSIDYIFIDPPFGGNLMYSELNFIWESWLKVFSNIEEEAITNPYQKKGLKEYQNLMLDCFNEFFRILKPGRWITVEFSNTKAKVWNAIQATLQEAGFIVANVASLDKKQGSFKAVTTPTAVKQDLIISAYKSNGGLEKRFLKKADTEEGIWDFIQTHLKNLPVVKPKGGQLEFITERDPRILYDRTIAFYVRHGIPVPLSSPEFQVGLADRLPERDGMYFLPDQAAEYDKKRLKMEGLGQMAIWVEDERSAADWLRNFLKNKPSKYNEIQPEFFEQLNQSWKKWETRPELRALLDQYFLSYDGEGNVPPQIHSYLSTNFKDLRKLPADSPLLRSKAKDRWYVPDPRKNADVEKLREKRLLEEFWTYLPPGYDIEAIKRRVKSGQETLPGFESLPPKIPKGKRLKLVRTEAVRVGFKQCYQIRDYQTIIAVAHYIPEDVVNEDDQLQMIYDSAVTRSGLEI